MSTSRLVRCLRTVTAAVMIQVFGLSAFGAAPAVQQATGLFVPSASHARLNDSLPSTIVRRRPVTVWFDQTVKPEGVPLRLDFNLFEGVRLVGEVDAIQRDNPKRRVLTGRLTGLHDGAFTIVIQDGVMIGDIRARNVGSFQIRFLGDGVHEIREIDESKFPPCATDANDLGALPPAGAVQEVSGGLCDDDGSMIDLMVVYTAEARQAQGGTTAMEALIALAESSTNQAYAASAITTTSVRVVLTHETDYEESGSSSTDRLRISQPNDGFMDEVPGLRDIVSADVVILLVNNFEVCGRAFFSISAGNVPHEELGFNVVQASCAVGNRSFAHELAHNQGCRHNREADPSNGGAFLYSHGYYDPSNAFRTIMGVFSSTVPRIGFFSNPDVLYQGLPTGAPINQSNSADNALTIINTAFNVANFRRTRDCNNNGVCDDVEIASGTLADCNGNGLPDICEDDCNANGFADECDVANGTSPDCNGNGIPDECDPECNGNGIPDVCDIEQGTSPDCNGNGIPDECEAECNGNGIPDDCDIAQGTSQDCTGNGIPDECEPDCNTNGVADSCDITDLTSADVNGNGRPDECEPPILFVNANATGANTGLSWNDAFVSLSDALAVAGESAGLVDEIWIAAGTYKPAGPGGDRELTFNLVDAVGLYGGFAGTETIRAQRDPALNETILSGDLNANDGPDFTNYEDNSYHIVSATNVGPATVLDGLTLTAGSADGPFPHNSGGGVVIDTASPTIVNCLFTLNNAFTAGPGVNLVHAGQPRIDRCTFLNNKAAVEGGAIGIFFEGADPLITSCVFRGNTANFGGVFFFSLDTRPTVMNCTIIENTGNIDGIIHVVGASQTTINGCIIRNNSGVNIFMRSDNTLVTVSYSNVEGGAAGVTTQDTATLIWKNNNIDADPLFDVDGLHLLDGSPCIGKGDPSADASGFDIDAEPRVQLCRVDMGADESPFSVGDCNSNGQPDACDVQSGASPDANLNGVPDECDPRETIYVNASTCVDPGSGTVADPFCRIQSALDAASDGSSAVVEIIVADGTYTGPSNFDLDFGGKVLTLRSENGPVNCIVDAGGVGRGFYFHNAEGLASVLDGFTIRGGVADVGGGIYFQGAAPLIKNCIITNNQAANGGGIRIDQGANPTIRNCVIANNDADNGGGLSCDVSSATVEDCTFNANHATGAASGQGGGAWLNNCDATLTSCTFDGNTALAGVGGLGSGGGIYIQAAGPLIQGCTFTSNQAGAAGGGGSGSGGGIRFEQFAAPTIRDCVLSNNEADNGGGLSCNGSAGSIENGTFNANRATGAGSANGGGANLDGCTTTLVDCTFEANTALIATVSGTSRAAGAYVRSGSPQFVRCRFTNNVTGDLGNSAAVDDRLGGGLFMQTTSATLQDTTISGNSARSGGGVYIASAFPVFERCVIEGNTVIHPGFVTNGGGVYTINGAPEFRDCTLRNNVANIGHGGGVYNVNGDITLTQCLLVGNRSTRADALGGWGGGLYSLANGVANVVSVIGCDVYGNSADSNGGGVYMQSSATENALTLANSILWGNISVDDVETNQLRLDCTICANSINYNAIEGLTGALGGVGNVGGDPGFVDPDGADNIIGTADDDFRINGGSPVIDAGDNTVVPVFVTADIGGNPRFVNDPSVPDTGNGTAPIIDMGVYEGGVDCNGNGVSDPEDIANGTSQDCSGNGFPDECEPDCNGNALADSCDILNGTSLDCNTNDIPDECDLLNGTSGDCNSNTIPDDCEPDADNDGVINDCDGCVIDPNKIDPGVCGCGVADTDSDGDTVPNCVDICPGFDDLVDSDHDGVPNGCDLCPGFDDTQDADGDSIPDGCDACPGFDDLADADGDGVADGCDLCPGFDDTLDCNLNAVADGCDIRDATSLDVDNNGIPDECDPPTVTVSGSRYITWTPLPGPDPIALRIVTSSIPCAVSYVDMESDPVLLSLGIGRLVDTPVFHTADEWGTVHIRDEAIVPGASYSFVSETDRGGSIVQSSMATIGTMARGDTNGDGEANFVDISNVVLGFQSQLQPGLALPAVDLRPCLTDGKIDFTDITADVDAFQTRPDLCGTPCP